MKGYQLTLFHPTETTVGLEAFLAYALTGLNNDQMSLMRQLSNLITQICAKHNISVHEPSEHTADPTSHPDISDVDTFRINRERVLASDLLIHFTHFPSTDAGQVLDFAYSALLPMVIISKSDESVSQMITGIPSFKIHIRYQNPLELRDLLEDCLDKIKPILRERKLAFSNSSTNFVGKRIRTLRKQQGMSRKEVAANVDYLTEETLKQTVTKPWKNGATNLPAPC
jgi:hypothetical protein